MTEEQLAEKWVDEWGICCRAENMNANQFAKQAYIAGYNEAQNTITQCNRSALSGVKWHKVADGDLPNTEREVLVYMWDSYYLGYYEQRDGEDRSWHFEDFDEESEQVTAWCEIPQFKE